MDEYISHIEKFDAAIKTALGLGLIIVIWSYFYFKSKSLYSILDKLWSLFVGSKGFNNESINSFHKDQHDIDKFNAIYNFNATNTTQIEKFVNLIESEMVDIRQISSMKGWFDLNILKPVRPPIFETWVLAFFSVLIFSVSIVFLTWGVTENAILKLNKNDPWIMINHDRAKPVFNKLAITKENCLDKKFSKIKYSEITELDPESINTLCTAFYKKSEMEAVDKIINGQTIFSYLAAFTTFLLMISLKNLFRRLNAYHFYFHNKKIHTTD